MELDIALKKAAKRRRQRLRRKEKILESSLKENQVGLEKQEEEGMNRTSEKTRGEILAERQAKKTAKPVKKVEPNAVSSMAPVKSTTPKSAVLPASGAKISPQKPISPKQVAGKVAEAALTPLKSTTSKSVAPPISDVKSPLQKPTSLKPNVTSATSKPLEKSPKPATMMSSPISQDAKSLSTKPQENEKTKEQIHQEREARRLAKLVAKKKTDVSSDVQQPPPEIKPAPGLKINLDNEFAGKMEKIHTEDDSKAKSMTKAERRAIQEAQRAAKAKALEEKKPIAKKPVEYKKPQPAQPSATIQKQSIPSSQSTKSSAVHKVKLFKHLYSDKCDFNINVNQSLHPAVVKLGLQFANDAIVGSNARCYAFLNAMKILINDYATPPEKVFSRGLEAEIQPAIEFLQNCRPLAVSMTNALKHIKGLITFDNSNESDEEKKQRLIEKIDTYASEQIETAAIAISLKVREKISNGDVILTYGCSSLIKQTLVEAYKDSLRFRVIVVDSRPDHEGQEMLKSLAMLGINCTYVMINAISFIMPEVSKVLLGAHALLANGFVMSRVGTAQVALVASSYNVPVLVCCETHKFSERVQTDAFVFNELGDPNALVGNKNTRENFDHLKDWESIPHLTPLNIRYDITPPELVTAVITEVAILPCTSVQVILRRNQVE